MDENTIPDPTLEESLQLLISQVPVPVRDFILNELGTKTEELMQRYRLHIDQGTTLEHELLLMLLGQEEPTEFVTALEEAGVAPLTVQALANDINQEIFMKLRGAETTPGAVAAPAQSVPVQAALPPQPTYAPPEYVPPTPVAVPPPVASVSQFSATPIQTFPAPQPRPQPVSPVPSSIPTSVPPPPANLPGVLPHTTRTMEQDMEMVQHMTTAPVVPTAPVAPTPAPQASPAISQPPAYTPPSAPTPVLPNAPQKTENREALHAILKSYGVDPYREPAD